MLTFDSMYILRLIGFIALVASLGACTGGSAPPGSSGGGSGGFFSDDFDGAVLDPSWTVLSGSFAVSGGSLVEAGDSPFTTAQLLWEGGLTGTPDQYAKLQLVDLGVRSWGFILRYGDGSDHHYEVHLTAGSSEWRWDLNNPDFVERVGACSGDQPPAPDDWLGVVVEGAGANTKVSVWRWDADPDPGAPDVLTNWGTPDCQIQANPSVAAEGRAMGIRSYTGSTGSPSSIDNWAGGDLTGDGCGNGVVEPGEACDGGGETATCNANCTLADCGDGIFNPLAEQCELDASCSVGEICNPSCVCEVPPPPVCGNGIHEPGEYCDEGGQSSSCDADCTFSMCGDAFVNPVGEQCEQNADCTSGELCLGCTCVVSSGQRFADEFERGSLGPDWVVDAGTFATQGGALVEVSGATSTNARMRYVSGQTEAVDQFSKLRVVQSATHTWGFIFRAGAASEGDHYQVALDSNGRWNWDLHDPDFVEAVGSCSGGPPSSDGDWIAAAIEGSGANTVVSGWRWPADPDAGGPVDITNNWGPPNCQVTAEPSEFIDVGGTIGIRSDTGDSTSTASADGWSGGDLVDPIVAPRAPITLILDRSGEGPPDSMIRPDGIAVDSAGNVYVAACGLSSASTGLFKITPGGNVTRLIDSTGDGVSPFNCGVGVDVDSSDNVYVVAFLSDNIFKVTPTGEVTQILDSSGAGSPNSLSGPIGVAVNDVGDVYVSAFYSDNVHKVTPEGDKSLVLDSSGDGMGNSFLGPFEIDTDPFGNVFVAAHESDNVFKITPAGPVSEVIDASGDGTNPLSGPHGVGCDAAGNVYVTGNTSDNVFRIEPSGTITQIMDISGDGAGNLLDNPTGLKATADGKVYVTAFESDNAFEWDSGTATQILTILGDGFAPFDNPADDTVAIGPNGELYVTGTDSDTVFRVLLP